MHVMNDDIEGLGFPKRKFHGKQAKGLRYGESSRHYPTRKVVTPPLPKRLQKHFSQRRSFLKPVQLKREIRTAPFIGHVRARNEVIAWLKKYAPEVVRIVAARNPALLRPSWGVAGLGAAPATAQAQATSSWADKLLDLAKVAVPLWQQNKYQSRIIDLQLERARQGKPPLDVQEYSAPSTASLEIRTPGLNLTRMLPIIALIGGAAFVVPKLMAKKR